MLGGSACVPGTNCFLVWKPAHSRGTLQGHTPAAQLGLPCLACPSEQQTTPHGATWLSTLSVSFTSTSSADTSGGKKTGPETLINSCWLFASAFSTCMHLGRALAALAMSVAVVLPPASGCLNHRAWVRKTWASAMRVVCWLERVSGGMGAQGLVEAGVTSVVRQGEHAAKCTIRAWRGSAQESTGGGLCVSS